MWVHNEIVKNIAACCTAYGVAEEAVYREAGIGKDALADKDGRQDWTTGIHVWEATLKLTGYRFIGLSFGKQISFAVLGWIAPLTTSSPTLRHAWKTFADYFPLMSDMMAYTVTEMPDGNIQIAYQPATAWLEASPLTAALAAEHAMSLSLSMSGYLCGQQVKPVAATLMHTMPAGQRSAYQLLSDHVRFGQDAYTLVFDTATAALPVITANRLMYEQMQQLCNDKLRELQHTAGYTSRVLQILNSKQTYYSPKLDEVAAMLNMTARTLQRKLKEEQETYQSILERYQADLALQLLKQPGTKVKEVAFALGFNSLQSFSRAFKRKTGKSPVEVMSK